MTRSALEEIRSCQESDRVLPGVAYRDPEVFEAEIEQIFRTSTSRT